MTTTEAREKAFLVSLSTSIGFVSCTTSSNRFRVKTFPPPNAF